MFVDYYQILKINREANDEQIKAAYREQAFLYHPDRNSEESAHQRFVEINEAYRILSDSQERQKYDRLHDRHHGKKIKSTTNSGFESLERTRAKRASRYNRSMYNQRMRYRGSSTTSSSSASRPSSSRSKPRTRPYSERYEKIVLDEAEASERGFSGLAKVLRIICIGLLCISLFMVVDKLLSIEKSPETVLAKEQVPWSFTQPNVIRIKTQYSTFGVQRTHGEKIRVGQRVRVSKSMFGDVAVAASYEYYGDKYKMDTYGGRYDSPFEFIWVVVIMSILTLVIRSNPQPNTYLGTITIFISLNILGLILFG